MIHDLASQSQSRKQNRRVFTLLLSFAVGLSIIPWYTRAASEDPDNLSQQPADAQSKAQITPQGMLEPGKPIEKELAGGQGHSYQIRLTAGQYLELVVEQRGIDLLVILFGPDGKELSEVDSPNGSQGPENVSWIVEASGNYRVEIRALDIGAEAGRYEVRFTERPATEKDRTLMEAQKLVKESEALENKGKFGEAIRTRERAVAIYEKTLGSEHVDTATALNDLAELYYEQGYIEQAEALSRRSLGIWEKTGHPDTASALQNLAVLNNEMGNYLQAERLYRRALEFCEKIGEIEHFNKDYTLYNILYNFSGHYLDMGDYAQAESLLRRGLEISEKSKSQSDLAISFNNLATLYFKIGDYTQAEPLFQRALEIEEKIYGPERPEVALKLQNLAVLYKQKQDYAKAELLNQRALSIYEKAYGPEHPDVADVLHNLAIMYYSRDDYAQAEPLLCRALAIYEKARGPGHPRTALQLVDLAVVLSAKGDYGQAESMLLRAKDIYEKVFGTEHPNFAVGLVNKLAMLYRDKSDYGQAIYHATRAAEAREKQIATILTIGSEHQKRLFLDTLFGETNFAISLHVHSAPADPQAIRLALTVILQRKGRALDAMSDQLASLRRDTKSQDQQMLDKWVSVCTKLSALKFGSGGGRITPEARNRMVSNLSLEKTQLEDEISRRSSEFRAHSQPVTIQAVQSAIPRGTALVEFAVYRPVDAKTPQGGVARYVAYVLTSQGEPRYVELGETATIDNAVDELRRALSAPGNDLQRARKLDEVKQRARDLDQMVMQPVRKLIGDAKRMLVSPDGALNLIPFWALVDEQGEYLIKRYAMSYLTSGRDLLRLQIARENKSAPLVVADPIFGKPSTNKQAMAQASAATEPREQTLNNTGDLDAILRNFDPVPGAADEALRLKRALPEARVLTRQAATETALKKASAPRILHISTHGFFLDDLTINAANERRASALRGVSGMSSSEAVTPAGASLLENPLLVSGLALAGANQRKSGKDDGILTALEVAGLDLWGTKLVVLSACDTGVGKVKNGEGVYGLRRALVLAGAESQVMSLWKVDGLATRDLMTDYYRRLKQGAGRGEALRQAQLNMLNSANRRHPFYWASFIQSGEWGNLDGMR